MNEIGRSASTEISGLDVDLQALAGQAGSENFPVALRFLPKRPRQRLERVYAYSRFVDDIGDEAAGNRSALLDHVERDVRRLHVGSPVLPPVCGMQEIVDDCDMPLQPMLDLIDANRMDQVVSSYETFDDLLGYCRLSAAPIGLMVLYVAGAATEPNIADSDQVCAALQVLEHCQDVREDALSGRVYLPSSEVGELDLAAERTSSELRAVVRTQVERSEQLLQPGRALVGRLRGWSKIAVAGYLAGGLATVDALRAADYDVMARLLKPTNRRTAYHALRLLASR